MLRLQGGHQFGEVAEPVLGREVRPSLLGLPGIAGRGRRRQFFEEGLKPGRGYHLNCSRQLAGGIPERVSDTTRLDQLASLGRLALLICDADANRARGHVRLLILVGVDVRRHQAMRVQRHLRDAQPPGRLPRRGA